MRRVAAAATAALLLAVPAADAAKPKRCKGGKAKACRVAKRPGATARGAFGALVGVRARRPAPVAAPAAPPVSGTAPAPAGDPAPAPVTAPAAVPTAPVAVLPAAPVPARLQVTAREWSLTLSRPSVVAGPAIVELVNRGEDGHDLRVARDGATAGTWDELAPGATRKQTLELTAGTYQLFCSLPGHREAGMAASLAVTAG